MSLRVYKISQWSTFEQSDLRKIKRWHWLATPNKHDGTGFRRLLASADGLMMFGAWNLFIQVASKTPVRGVLADDTGPLTAEDFHVKFPSISIETFQKAFDLLSDPDKRICWLSVDDWQSVKLTIAQSSGEYPETSGKSPPTEQNRTGHNRTTPAAQGVGESQATSPRPRRKAKASPAEPENPPENPGNPPAVKFPPGLQALWDAAPPLGRERSNRPECLTQWRRLKLESRSGEILACLRLWLSSHAWTKDGGNYVPALHRWLQKRKFEQQPESTAESQVDQPRPGSADKYSRALAALEGSP